MTRGPNGADEDAGVVTPRRLFVYNGGFLTQRRTRRILQLAGWEIRLGRPAPADWIGVWGRSPTSPRGEAVSDRTGSRILRVEDAFLRSVHPGRDQEPPLGLLLDRSGVHFDSSQPSDLETLLATAPLDDAAMLADARDGIERLKTGHLSKYNAFDPGLAGPDAPYVLVIDQTRGDASIRHGGADVATFQEMLVFAQEEHPGARIVIKSHPETATGHRQGHFGPEDANDRITLLTGPVSPWSLLEGAQGVYTVSSQLGFEAILAGHRPRVFGQPFYSGWGLTADENPVARRQRRLTPAQLFAGAMLLYPTWYDPYRDRLCGFAEAVDTLAALARAWRADHQGYAAYGMRAWKRAPLQKMLGQSVPVRFHKHPDPPQDGRRAIVWAGKAGQAPPGAVRVEDGFLRSRGLGADLVPPLSLVLDDIGIYYDPGRESRLERLIAESPTLPHSALARADALRRRLISARVSKYNPSGVALPDLPAGHRILVAGQVEDDASLLTGGGAVRTNSGLLQAVRQARPEAVIVYKPHPDVEAGLRPGRIDEPVLAGADLVLTGADPLDLIDAVEEVWTMTSLLGFEALIRGKRVTCLGMPFYAGWGLTTDLAEAPDRRQTRPVLQGLIHAALIDYPRYHDPVTGLPCPPEVAVDRLADRSLRGGGAGLRTVARLQGWLAGYAWLWR